VDFLALVERLKVESARSGGPVVSVATALNDDARLVNWIADAWLELQRRPHGWTWMRAELAGPTVAGQAAYEAADIGLWSIAFTAGSSEYTAGETLTQGANSAIVKQVTLTSGAWSGTAAGTMLIKPVAGTFTAGAAAGGGVCTLSGPATTPGAFDRWVPPTIEGYAVMATDSAGQTWRLDQMAWDRFKALESNELVPRFRPITHWAIDPNERLYIGPTPTEVFTLRASYYKTPTPFTLDTDAPTFASQYHMILVWRALMELSSFDAAPEVYARAQVNFANIDREMQRRYGPLSNHGLSHW
jgi:hypothetical protein